MFSAANLDFIYIYKLSSRPVVGLKGGGYLDTWESGFWAVNFMNLTQGKYQSSTKPATGNNFIYNLSSRPVVGLGGLIGAMVLPMIEG